MPFGNKARQVKAYEFGCLPPTEGEEKALEVMKLRYRLWNQLVELDHKYDEQRESLLAQYVTITDDEEHHKQYLAERKAAFKIENVQEQLKVMDKAEYEEARNIGLQSGLYWCNTDEVKLSWQQARKKPGDIRFHSSRDGGKTSVRWQTGLPVAEAFSGNNTLLKLKPIDDEAYTSPIRSVRRKKSQSMVSIRVASDNRKPVWLILPCVLHRPLPDGLIRSASVLRERIATHWRWKLVVVVETKPDNTPKFTNNRSESVAIKIGWSKKLGGLRTCYWVDGSGNQGELLLSNYFMKGMGRVDSIKSKRDLDFNKARDSLVAWKKKTDSLPEWFKERTKTLSLWKAIAKLAALVIFWRNNRFDGDEDIFPVMEAWRKEDKHHYEYEANLRDRLIRQRREQYRLFASEKAKDYSKVVIENYDLRPLVKRGKKGGKADDLPQEVRHDRVMAAVSTLRLAIKNACNRDHVDVKEVDAVNTARTCCICGSVDFDRNPEKRKYVCPNCKKVLGVKIVLDKDYNATQNLLLDNKDN